jgi:hypothetical protein
VLEPKRKKAQAVLAIHHHFINNILRSILVRHILALIAAGMCRPSLTLSRRFGFLSRLTVLCFGEIIAHDPFNMNNVCVVAIGVDGLCMEGVVVVATSSSATKRMRTKDEGEG